MTAPARRKPRPLLKAALLVTATLLALLLGEVLLRGWFWFRDEIAPPDRSFSDTVGWKVEGNQRRSLEHPIYGKVEYSTADKGFRLWGDTEATSATRVLVIGDSYTQAREVSDGQTYMDVLAREFPDVEVFAYGCAGYGTLQEYLILDRYVDAIAPDLILWQMCGNDFTNNSHEMESRSVANNNLMERPYWEDGQIRWRFPHQDRGAATALLQRSALARLVRLQTLRLGKPRGSVIEEQLAPDNPLLRRSVETTKELFDLVRQRVGPDVEVVVFCADEIPWCGDCLREITEPHRIGLCMDVARAIAEAKNRGEAVDFLPADSHWTAAGHRVAGETLARWLRAHGILNARP